MVMNEENVAMNALIQKFEVLTSLEFWDSEDALVTSSTKIKTLKLRFSDVKDSFWNQLKLNFPNIEHLELEDTESKTMLKAIADQKWNLKYVKLIDLIEITVDDMIYFLENSPTLQTLIIPDGSMKANWSEREKNVKLFDDYIKKGLKVYVSNYKFNKNTQRIDREVLTSISISSAE